MHACTYACMYASTHVLVVCMQMCMCVHTHAHERAHTNACERTYTPICSTEWRACMCTRTPTNMGSRSENICVEHARTFEYEVSVRGDHAAGSLRTVCVVRRDDQLGLLAHAHLDHAFIPSLDDLHAGRASVCSAEEPARKG